MSGYIKVGRKSLKKIKGPFNVVRMGLGMPVYV